MCPCMCPCLPCPCRYVCDVQCDHPRHILRRNSGSGGGQGAYCTCMGKQCNRSRKPCPDTVAAGPALAHGQGFLFFTHVGCMLDAVIVVASLYADLRLGKQFVVTLRMWRLVRIAHGVFEAMETRLHEHVSTHPLPAIGSHAHRRVRANLVQLRHSQRARCMWCRVGCGNNGRRGRGAAHVRSSLRPATRVCAQAARERAARKGLAGRGVSPSGERGC